MVVEKTEAMVKAVKLEEETKKTDSAYKDFGAAKDTNMTVEAPTSEPRLTEKAIIATKVINDDAEMADDAAVTDVKSKNASPVAADKATEDQIDSAKPKAEE